METIKLMALRRDMLLSIQRAENVASFYNSCYNKNTGYSHLIESLLDDLKQFSEDIYVVGSILEQIQNRLDYADEFAKVRSQLISELTLAISLAVLLAQNLEGESYKINSQVTPAFSKLTSIVKSVKDKIYLPGVIYPLSQLITSTDTAALSLMKTRATDLLKSIS